MMMPSDSRRLPAWVALACAGLLAVSGCQRPAAPPPPPPVAPVAVAPPRLEEVFYTNKLAEMDAAIAEAIAAKKCPGGVLWVERLGVAYHKAFGNRALVPSVERMTEDTIFDAASVTKVVAGTPALMLLVERGKVDLDAPVQRYIPEFGGDGKAAITVRQLLTHTSGLRPDVSTRPPWSGQQTAIKLACEEKLQAPPGTKLRYSDINLFLVGEIVERVSGRKLSEFAAAELYAPLRMADTGFLPPNEKLARVAPTEVVEDQPFRGVVHDPTARYMGGVAGHAGLFTTAADLARFARMMLNGGELDGARVFQPGTIRLMTSVQTPAAVEGRRGLGWDIDTSFSGPRGRWFPPGSYGHTGWTGTSLWIDPFSRTFVIFLSNRNHPTEAGNVIALRHRLGTLAAEAVIGFNFVHVPGALAPRPGAETNAPAVAPGAAPRRAPQWAEVLNGIDVLKRQQFAPLRGLRVGLISNHTGVDRERRSTVALLRAAPEVKLAALFSPEHGFRGALDEKVGDSVDEQTGLPIYSLYGETRRPKPEQLRGLDALVFDIQDIGCRFYTYISTMGLCMEAAGEAGLKYFVLDRVNPINAVTVDGPVLTGETSFTAFHTLPVRYAMTIGELAKLYHAERGLKTDLTVVPVENWSRAAWLDETGLPWSNPSPNMRSLTQATLYPGVGLLETTALSVGRGTDTPFEVVGAPYIDDVRLAAELNRAALPGVRFLPVRFTPTASVFKGQPCAGVNIFLTDRDTCRVVDIGLLLAGTLHRLYPTNFNLEKFDRLLGHRATMDALAAGKSIEDIRARWAPALAEFNDRRAKHLLYK